MESSNFPKTKILQSETLNKKRNAIWSGKLKPSFFGVSDRGGDKPPELLYLCEIDNKDAKVNNCCHLASNILSESKNIFFSKVLTLLRYFKPECLEVNYLDTDSCICTVTNADLAQIFKPEYEKDKMLILSELMEDAESEFSQHGLFKCEGIYKFGLFRSAKTYLLRHETTTQKDAVRVRSIPRKLHGYLDDHHFKQDTNVNRPSMRCLSMMVTKGLEVLMTEQSRSLAHSLNTKRKMLVRKERDKRVLENKNKKLAFFTF